MKLFIKLLIVFFTFFFTSQVFANDTVNYISMNKILNESMAGLSIKNKLEKIHKSNIEKFKTKDQDFKTKEQSLLSKRNLMKKDEFELKINDLRERSSSASLFLCADMCALTLQTRKTSSGLWTFW